MSRLSQLSIGETCFCPRCRRSRPGWRWAWCKSRTFRSWRILTCRATCRWRRGRRRGRPTRARGCRSQWKWPRAVCWNLRSVMSVSWRIEPLEIPATLVMTERGDVSQEVTVSKLGSGKDFYNTKDLLRGSKTLSFRTCSGYPFLDCPGHRRTWDFLVFGLCSL